MSTRTEIFGLADRKGWPTGPWDGEPDHVEWIDQATRRRCQARRGPCGNWNGYVGVDLDHPWFGRSKENLVPYPDVHGGLTFGGQFTGDASWYFGFDCAHLGDLVPGAAHTPFGRRDEFYRPVAFVEEHCASLAAQIDAAPNDADVLDEALAALAASDFVNAPLPSLTDRGRARVAEFVRTNPRAIRHFQTLKELADG